MPFPHLLHYTCGEKTHKYQYIKTPPAGVITAHLYLKLLRDKRACDKTNNWTLYPAVFVFYYIGGIEIQG